MNYKNNAQLWYRFFIHCSNPISPDELRDYLISCFQKGLVYRGLC